MAWVSGDGQVGSLALGVVSGDSGRNGVGFHLDGDATVSWISREDMGLLFVDVAPLGVSSGAGVDGFLSSSDRISKGGFFAGL